MNENKKIFYTLKEMINKNLIKIENEKLLNEIIENEKLFLKNIKRLYLYENKNLINENYLFIEFYYLKVNDLIEIEKCINNVIELYKIECLKNLKY